MTVVELSNEVSGPPAYTRSAVGLDGIYKYRIPSSLFIPLSHWSRVVGLSWSVHRICPRKLLVRLLVLQTQNLYRKTIANIALLVTTVRIARWDCSKTPRSRETCKIPSLRQEVLSACSVITLLFLLLGRVRNKPQCCTASAQAEVTILDADERMEGIQALMFLYCVLNVLAPHSIQLLQRETFRRALCQNIRQTNTQFIQIHSLRTCTENHVTNAQSSVSL